MVVLYSRTVSPEEGTLVVLQPATPPLLDPETSDWTDPRPVLQDVDS